MKNCLCEVDCSQICVHDSDIVTLVISKKAALDLVSDEIFIQAETLVEVEYAALAALGMDK